MRQLQKHIPVLEYIQQLSPKDQKSFINTASKPLLHCLSGLCLNIIKRQIPLSASEIKKLRKFERTFECMEVGPSLLSRIT